VFNLKFCGFYFVGLIVKFHILASWVLKMFHNMGMTPSF
jgi:hypothetical protein